MLTRRTLLASLALAPSALPQQPDLHLRARSRRQGIPFERELVWKPAETAIIICDMWNDHYCKSAARRLELMIPRMNHVTGEARKLGVRVIHAPSGTMDQYEGHPARKRMKAAEEKAPPVPIAKWCYLDLKDESALPVDDATEPCDDSVVGARVRVFNRQHPGLVINDIDGISDSGQEIYNFFEENGIKNIAMMGVHTNMCVLGRPFGIRQLVRLGKNVVLARDLTDAMYDPRQAPWVSHERGTSLILEHVEKFWCPTIAGENLTRTGRGAAA
ncbi:MAG: cysteine hydrolase [Acidobacteria bacterium]|nr:cysteine hydrolase [Acidobacteriota bacterium]